MSGPKGDNALDNRTSVDGTTGIAPEPGDNESRDTLSDRFGRLWVRLHNGVTPIGAPLTFDDSVVLEAASVSSAAPATFIQAIGTNTDVVTQHFQLFDGIVIPANGAIPIYSIPVAAGQPFSVDMPIAGRAFAVGIVWCFSLTLPIKTIAGAIGWVNLGFVV